jgi:predicted DNA-binding protein (MmcQ/YjbR family)
MNIEDFREYCLSKKGVTEELPFGPEHLVFKVIGKIFAITSLESFESVNLKCDPEEAVLLREKYDAVLPGYHMNKKHWNSILMDGSIPDKLFLKWVDHSYEQVVNSLTKKQKEELKTF